jgi:hypothetical protein
VAEQSAKQRVLEAVKNLPDDATIEDAIDRLLFLSKVQAGLDQLESGDTVGHADAKARILK